MSYTHGIYVYENPTPIIAPLECDSAIQVIVGTAPVNMIADPKKAVNTPIIAYSFSEAVAKAGYSDDFKKFTICQSIDASFRIYNVAPIILINVLDPEKHKKQVAAAPIALQGNRAVIEAEGILLGSVVVKASPGGTTYVKDEDYTLAFNDKGQVVIAVVSGGAVSGSQVSVSYDILDPSMVTPADIIGGYNAGAGTYSGLELIERIYPKLGVLPGQIVAPGWSHIPGVAAVITAKSVNINGSFKCTSYCDIDTNEAKTYDAANEWKSQNGYTDENMIACWPMATVGEKIYYMSAILAALTAFTDANNGNVPYMSPSNKMLKITGTVLSDGTEVNLDQVQGNYLNGIGVCTAINIDGWRSWGNNTSIFPASTDVKDRFIPTRRMFNWWGNTFIRTYLQKVDDPMNFRLIESIVDSENIRANGFQARGMIASGKISFNQSENPITDILNGKIRFKQELAFFPPAETIINVLEFDPYALKVSLTGGAN